MKEFVRQQQMGLPLPDGERDILRDPEVPSLGPRSPRDKGQDRRVREILPWPKSPAPRRARPGYQDGPNPTGSLACHVPGQARDDRPGAGVPGRAG